MLRSVRTRRLVIRIGMTTLIGSLLLAMWPAAPADAHGSTEDPASRVYACRFDQPNNPMCADAWAANSQALYDWMEVNIGDAAGRHRDLIPDGQLCGAGRAKYEAFNRPGPWPVTALRTDGAGLVALSYQNTAPHATEYYRVYITNPDFDARTDALRWEDLELVHDSGPLDRSPRQTLRVALPDRTVPAILYVVWQRSDSPEAFYACSDVTVTAGSGPTPTSSTTTSAPTTAPVPPTTAETTPPSTPTSGPTSPPVSPPPTMAATVMTTVGVTSAGVTSEGVTSVPPATSPTTARPTTQPTSSTSATAPSSPSTSDSTGALVVAAGPAATAENAPSTTPGRSAGVGTGEARATPVAGVAPDSAATSLGAGSAPAAVSASVSASEGGLNPLALAAIGLTILGLVLVAVGTQWPALRRRLVLSGPDVGVLLATGRSQPGPTQTPGPGRVS